VKHENNSGGSEFISLVGCLGWVTWDVSINRFNGGDSMKYLVMWCEDHEVVVETDTKELAEWMATVNKAPNETRKKAHSFDVRCLDDNK